MKMMMEEVLTALFVVLLSLLLTKVAYDTLSCYWLTPRRIKKIMERQGVRGPKPRLLIGNILDVASLVSKSTSHDMNSITHDVVSRLLPHYVAWSKQYGTTPVSYGRVMCGISVRLYLQLLFYYNYFSSF